MPVRAVTFDCAQTLMKVDWRPDVFAVSCAEAAGIRMPAHARDLYLQLFLARQEQFLEANRLRSNQACKAFYEDLCATWLERLDLGCDLVPSIMEAGDRLAFGPESILFEPFSESIGAVQAVRDSGVRTAVLSNWDITLHRVLDTFGFGQLVEFAIASLEEGYEKPDPRLFDLAVQRFGLRHDEVLHVGDSVVDDFEGAENAGLLACLIDRGTEPKLPFRISSLTQVPEAIACYG
jgi:putative hydrolase of the HAD superfamily